MIMSSCTYFYSHFFKRLYLTLVVFIVYWGIFREGGVKWEATPPDFDEQLPPPPQKKSFLIGTKKDRKKGEKSKKDEKKKEKGEKRRK